MAFREKGLWLPGMRIEIQEVKKAHRKPCTMCGDVPQERRLLMKVGATRAAVDVLCEVCGVDWIRQLRKEGTRAMKYLALGDTPDGGAVRVESTLRQALKPKAKEKED